MSLKKTNHNIDSRLLKYSLTAGALLIASAHSNAGVVYTDVDENGVGNLSGHGDFYDVNFGGGGAEFRLIVKDHNTSYGGVDMQILNGTGSHLWTGAAFLQNVEDINSGALVDGPAPHPDGAAGWRYFNHVYVLQDSSGSWYRGSGFLADNKFIGVRFHIDSKLCYGWIRVKATSTRSLKIYDFAYESTDGVGIITDSSLPVELSSFTASQAKGAINISWTTESETDNLGFILERQLKGETNWATIASYKTHTQLAGQGNKTSQTKYNFADKNVQSGNTYLYRLTDIDINGNVSSRHVITVNTTDIVLPDKTELLSAYPNPFNPGTSIEYRLEADSDVTLSVIDITGRTVQTLVTENQSAGSYTSSWDGLDNAGQPTPSGLYILVLKAGNNITTQKVTRIR